MMPKQIADSEVFLTDQLVLIKTDSVCFMQVQTQYQFALFNSLSLNQGKNSIEEREYVHCINILLKTNSSNYTETI